MAGFGMPRRLRIPVAFTCPQCGREFKKDAYLDVTFSQENGIRCPDRTDITVRCEFNKEKMEADFQRVIDALRKCIEEHPCEGNHD